MNFCLDTHLMLRAMLRPEKLSSKASKLIPDRQHQFCFSVVSLWEIAIKTSLGRPNFNVDARVLRRHLLEDGYTEIPIQSEHVFLAATLPPLHKVHSTEC